LWIASTGFAWRDLLAEFGEWFTVHTRFRRWAQQRARERDFAALSDDPDFQYVMIDGTICPVHHHGAGARRGTHIQVIGPHPEPAEGRAAV
ncbi:MAG: transposase, partial [Methylocella sp.]